MSTPLKPTQTRGHKRVLSPGVRGGTPAGRQDTSPVTTLHGVLLRVRGVGVLLTGASGVGKSELALELLSRGHHLIADDAAEFRRSGQLLRGSCPPLLKGFIEVRSLGILNVPRLFGRRSVLSSVRLDLVLSLETPQPASEHGLERLSGHRRTREILGVQVDEISIPIRLGHNLSVLVETACRDFSLRRAGYHADADMTQRQMREIRRQQTAATGSPQRSTATRAPEDVR